MKQATRLFGVLGIGFLIGTGISLGTSVHAERGDAANDLPLEDLRALADVFGKIKSDYVESIDDEKLLGDAINGMLAGLDPHSAYLGPDSFREMRIGTEGQFGGLGIEVTMENGFVKVVAPIDDTPAYDAGIKSGDVIIKLDNKPVKGMALNEAVDMMRGKPGTDITLTIVREGREKPFDVVLTRDIIRITSVRGRLLEPDYGYIRISQFQAGTGANLRKKISNLKVENDGPLKGLVLDLRDNPGGVLNAAVNVSDTFLKDGQIVATRGRTDDANMEFTATPQDYLDNAPLVVLINGGSASASEIVAGALQDHKRAVVMGTKSFGKGSVQTILPMGNGAALKITTALYYTPNDRSIQATGIVPDIEVDNLVLSKPDSNDGIGVRESDLAGHLENGNGDSDSSDTVPETALINDYQLNQALNLLKGISIVRTTG